MNAVFGTTACWPGLHYRDAVAKLVRDTHEPYLGAIGCGQIQLCPQNSGLLDDTEIDFLLAEYPATAFRLHANARVSRHSRPGAGDAIDFRANDPHFQAIIKTSQRLNAAGYTLHSGKRSSGSHNDLRSKVLALQDLMQIPVGVEGMYPDGRDTWLLDTWDEYAWLLASGLRYAIDLSHINILVRRSRRTEEGLVKELLASQCCIEIHVSGNDGLSDRHQVLERAPAWATMMANGNANAIVFTEGNQINLRNHIGLHHESRA